MAFANGVPTGLMRARPLASSATLPAFGESWPFVDCLRPDFIAGVQITHAYTTLEQRAFTGGAQRAALAGAARRTVEYVLGAQAPGDAVALLAGLRRMARAPTLAPLWSEQTELTEDVLGGFQDFVKCDPSWRLLARGQRVMLVDAEAASGPHGASGRGMAWPYFELHRVRVSSSGGDPIQPDRVRFEAADSLEYIQRSFRAGARLVPLIDVEPLLISEPEWMTDRHARIRVALRELGATAGTASTAFGADPTQTGGPRIPPLVAFGSSPSGATVIADGLPLLDVRFEGGRSRAGFAATALQGRGNDDGLGAIVVGPYAPHRLRVESIGFTRERARRLLQFFDSRAAGALPFFARSPVEELRVAPSVTSVTGTTLDIERTRVADRSPAAVFPVYSGTAGAAEWILIERRDGSRYARRVTARVNTTSGGKAVERLTLHEALPTFAVSELLGIARLVRVRFAQDGLTEQWIDGRHARSAFSLEEVVDERSIDVAVVGPVGEPCADCQVASGGPCPGSDRWEGPLPVAGAGSDERAACDLDGDFDLVLGAAPTIRVVGFFHGEYWENAFGGAKRLQNFASAAFDVELPRGGSTWTDRWRLDTGAVGVAQSPKNLFRRAGPYSAGAGPTTIPAGTLGFLNIEAQWYNAESDIVRLFVRVTGVPAIDSNPSTQGIFTINCSVNAAGAFTGGASWNALALSPVFGGWSGAVTSRQGITAMTFGHRSDYSLGGRVEFGVGVHVCPVFSCESE
ncbi:MAG: hypothetical protein KF684_04070 [Phycisphaeraceae bacterium]|nr:hypothetical protein [Phycisphaeraceae bacterium]